MIAALGSLLKWALFIAVIATGVHLATLYYLPHILMARAMAQGAAGGALNTMIYPDRRQSKDILAQSSPGFLVANCTFNLAQNQLQISLPAPDTGAWSMTIYDEDARPFYFTDNATASAQSAVLVAPGGEAGADAGSIMIQSPSFDGIVVIRTPVHSDLSAVESDKLRRQASCRALSR
jgi:uncharacterized membrane protein